MKLFRTISSLILAILVLVSSSSFMVGIHYCAGKVQNIALFTKADACEKELIMPPCHRHLKAPCCEDQTVVHKGEDLKASIVHDQLLPPSSIDIEQPLVLISEIIPTAPFSRVKYFNYDPPLPSSDLTIDHQVFLI